MKQALFYIIFLIYVLPVMGQNKITYDPYSVKKKNIVKVNLLSGFLATINLSYETKITYKWSVQSSLAYTNLKLDGSDRKKTSMEGFQVGIDLRQYWRQRNEWNGWYSQLMLRYCSYDYHYYVQDSTTNNVVVNYQEKLKGISVGYLFGYQRTYRNRFVIDAFTGIFASAPIQYTSNPIKPIKNFTGQSFEINPYTNGGSIRLGLKIGYLF